MSEILVLKLNLEGLETWRYCGQVLERGDHQIVIEAYFNRPDTLFHGISLKQGDRFIETFYTNRWYNIFEIHDQEDDRLKGWYCNISFPAEIDEDRVSYIDLTLDLLVYPDGTQLVLDEDEFNQLPLMESIRMQARSSLKSLQSGFWEKTTGQASS